MKAVYYVATALVGAVMFWAGLAVGPLLDSPERQETVKQQEEVFAPGEAMDIQQAELSAEELAARGYLSAEALDIRIDDGEVQWFDGVIWHGVASVEEMAKEDKFYAAQEGFREFEEQLKQKEAGSTAEESGSSQGGTLSIGQREEPKPTPRPQSTNPQSTRPTVTEPVTVPIVSPVLEPQPTPAPEGNGGGGGGSQPSAPAPDSGNSGSGGSNSGSGNGGSSGDGGSGGGDGGSSAPGSGDSGSSGGDTGSGDVGGGDAGGGDSGGSDTGDGENMEWSDDYL